MTSSRSSSPDAVGPDAEALAVRDVAREVAERVLAPRAAELDRTGGFPTATLAEIAARGLLAVNIPRDLGGLQAGPVAYSLAITELARACAATTVAVCVSNMVAEVVVAFGNTEQRAHWVPRLARGELKVGAFALSEPGAGSDPGAMSTRARRTAHGWVLDGEKLWITSGSDAGLFVVWARTSELPGSRGLSCFLVPGDAPGLSRGRPEHKLGLRGSTTTALTFDACEVGDEARLGEEGRGFPVAMMALDGGRIGIASQALGIGQAAIAAAVGHLHAEGAQAADDQGAMWPLVDSATDLEAASLLTLRAAGLKRAGRPFSREASMAKLWASEKANLACLRAIEALGAAGIDRVLGVERCLRDVRVTTIYEGTSEIQRIVIGREVLRRFGEAT